MAVSARFYIHSIKKTATGYVGVEMMPAIRGEGNSEWSKFTPSGKIEMNVSLETGAAAWFESMLGKDVAITFEARADEEIS